MRFFHQQASNQRQENLIKGLFNDEGLWCTSDAEMEGIVLDYFGKLFSSSNPTLPPDIIGVLPQVIFDVMNGVLTRAISAEEVLTALKQMHPSKAPFISNFGILLAMM